MTVIQVRDCCGLGKNHGSYIDKKCSYFGYIFKVEPEEFLQLRFGMGGKYDSFYFGLKDGIAISWHVKDINVKIRDNK